MPTDPSVSSVREEIGRIELLRAREQRLLPTDMELLESMLRTAGTWAYADKQFLSRSGHRFLRR